MKNQVRGQLRLSSYFYGENMEMISFKTRVKNTIMSEAKNYREAYIEYEYLLYVSGVSEKYYIITGNKENYLHLVGVYTTLSPEVFFDKCIDELDESDFDFIDGDGKDIKGTVRRKIKVLNNFTMLMQQKKLYIQENFRKNNVICTVGATDHVCTAGFIKSSRSREGRAFPKTLMKGNELTKINEVEILLRKRKTSDKFDEILIGSRYQVRKYYDDLKEKISVKVYAGINNGRNDRVMARKGIVKQKGIPKCFHDNTYSEKLKKIKLGKNIK